MVLVLTTAIFMAILKTDNFWVMLIVVLILGAFIVPVIPLMLEFGCELCFPVGEGTSTGFLYAGAHLLAASTSALLGWLINGLT